jgi:DNA polymerase-1
MKIALIDANNLAFRCAFALKDMVTSTGLHSGAAYGMINALLEIKANHRPDEWIFVWDTRGSSERRRKMYPNYKRNRPPQPQWIYDSIQDARSMISAMGFCQVDKEGVEGDDILAYLADDLQQRGNTVLLFSEDKDMLQMLTKDIQLHTFSHGRVEVDKDGYITYRYNKVNVRLKPEQVVDFKALVGDKGDGYTGVVGFGPVAAQKFFAAGNTLSALMDGKANLANQSPAVRAKLQAEAGNLAVYRQLAELDKSAGAVALPTEGMPNTTTLTELLQRLEINSHTVSDLVRLRLHD